MVTPCYQSAPPGEPFPWRPGIAPKGIIGRFGNRRSMKLTFRNVLNFISIVVTAFLVLIFLVGDWVQTYGTDLWMRVLWVVLLISLQTFLQATWKPSPRWERWIGWDKRILVVLAGLFLALAGGLGVLVVP